ncbi:alpha-2-macroglobulin family protein [Thetidibacter halocola]|uniref:Alpha-2-macroglobulin family protein n=1 Tax=Thetidibacter halocola TaxID=2827239 RepID=A0A8J7WB05_9RHOB|nr:alpha-2-macroglobulin family protein [Thetidibacter halocola]MBS0123432.1 alpha-2-macroglobulin family protein [Thetidibacter halocola]
MRRLVLALVLGALSTSLAVAQEWLPERRLVVTRDMDFPGGDLQPLFDTTFDACQRLCLNDPHCNALTFNQKANVCFPKTGISREEPFEGALSARVVKVDPAALTRAALRGADLAFLSESDLARARVEAEALALRHGGGQWTPAALLQAAQDERAKGNWSQAIHWTGAALAQTDEAALWLQYGAWSVEYQATQSGSDQRRYSDRAYLATINAYLRSGTDALRVAALYDLAQALEQQGRGRDMIPALRLAETLQPRADVSALLDEAIGKYGFRITEHVVEADAAAPRICAEFSEALVRAGVDYASYVRLPDPRLAVTASGDRLCVEGVEHGARYTLTFRAGLPSGTGESLVRDVPITAYVRDRAPRVGFPGRAYVLPRSVDAGLPVETVNLDTVDLVLRRVADANLIRTMQDNWFGQPLNRWEEDFFADTVAEEIWRGAGEVRNDLNRDMLTRLPMGDVVGDLPAGLYALTAAVPGDDEEGRATQWFLLSDIGLTTMQGTDGLTVFARGLADAGPLAGVEVVLMNRANRVLDRVTTDPQGVARFAPGLTRGTGGAAPAMVVARQSDADMAFLSLTDPAFDLSDRGVAGRAPAGPLDAFLATDRGAYRAGEVIHATALLRDARADAVADVPMTAVLTRPDGVEHSRHVSDGGIDGGHVFDLPLSASVPRGAWRLEVHADPKAPALASTTILVEDFVPERIDFDLTLPDAPFNPLSPPLMGVSARYLFGAPGADLTIEGDVTLSAQNRLDAFPRYRFGRHDADPAARREGLPADLRTDATGNAMLPLPMPELDAEGRPMSARITLRLAEASGRPVERSITRPVASPVPMIGIRPNFDDTLPEGAEAGFDLIALGPDLMPQAMAVTWEVNRVNTRYQWYQQYGSWYWEPVTTRQTVARGAATLGADPVRVSADVEWGAYEIVVERTDGAYVAASMGFDAGWYAAADAADSPDMLDMSLDAASYRVGDTATLRMVPRSAGKALVTVLADRVISMQAVEVAEGENTLQLPVTEEWGAGVYVTAQVLRPMDVAAGMNPGRVLGLAHAAVDPGARKLAVTLETGSEAAPRGPLTAAVRIDGLAPGEAAHVTVAAVDLGILNLTGFEAPDPSAHFFGQRRLGVEIRDLYGRLIDGMNGAMGQVRTGGDASAVMRMQSPPPTEDLVAFFSGPVTVDAEGKARVSFDLPDFNGTVRVMAVAWSAKGVGQAQMDVLVRDPVVMTASLPRFLAPGDQSRLLLEFTHAKGATGAMPLEVAADGLRLTGAPETVALAEGGKAAVSLPLVADDVGDFRIEIALTTPEGQRLTKALTLGVRANDPVIGQTRRFTLAPGQTFTLDGQVFDGFRLASSQALISAGPLARFDVPGLLASLDRYPYGCTEQVTSQALPLLYLSALAEPLGLGGADRMRQRVGQAVDKVLTRQSANGAFGLWRADSGDFWLDAYVTDFLSRARAAGHDVPDRAFASALDNLNNRIAYAPDFDEGGEDIAFALMVLAREGRAQVGDLRYYADERKDAFATPLALAQLGAALASYGDQVRADAMFAAAAARLSRQTPEGQVWRADYGTPMRDAAGLLTLAVESRSEAVDREALVAAIRTPRSTQEQAWALLAAHAMVQDPTVSGIDVDGVPATGPFLRRLTGAGLEPMTITNTGSGPTDVTLTTLGVPSGDTLASGYGYGLTRDYYTLEGDLVDPSAGVATGTRLVAVLTVRPAEDTRARLMIDDALPAGFEIDNPSLLQSGDLKALDWLEVAEVDTAEFRADRFLAAVTQGGADPIRLAYILRAVSPGAFHHPAALVEDMYRPDYRATTASGRVVIK